MCIKITWDSCEKHRFLGLKLRNLETVGAERDPEFVFY